MSAGNVVLWVLAAIFALFALLMWFAFLRPVPTTTAAGRIVEMQYKPEGTYQQHQSGLSRGFRMPNSIPMAEAYILGIELDSGERVAASVNVVESREYSIGQRVRIGYVVRGVPPIWERFTVVALEPVDS